MNNYQLTNSIWAVRHLVAQGTEPANNEYDVLHIIGADKLQAVCASVQEPTLAFKGYM